MIVVIADDITGAAEIAGVAWRMGFSVRLDMEIPQQDTNTDVLVIATDMRQTSADEASATTKEIIRQLKSLYTSKNLLFFKKTDSALRGHIVSELQTMMTELGINKALLLAQNPSKGRIINDGKYLINGIPLDETAFKNDPEFPARTSVVSEQLDGTRTLSLDAPLQEGINVAEAASQEDIIKQLNKADNETLLAGAADFFTAFIQQFAHDKKAKTTPAGNKAEKRLLLQGSTQSSTFGKNIKEMLMPDNVFHGSSPQEWIEKLKDCFEKEPSLAIRIPQAPTGGKAYAIRLRETMAEAAAQLLENQAMPIHLLIEGGATAFAVFKRLDWHSFSIVREDAPGIVTLSHRNLLITLKPGSYPWPSDIC